MPPGRRRVIYWRRHFYFARPRDTHRPAGYMPALERRSYRPSFPSDRRLTASVRIGTACHAPRSSVSSKLEAVIRRTVLITAPARRHLQLRPAASKTSHKFGTSRGGLFRHDGVAADSKCASSLIQRHSSAPAQAAFRPARFDPHRANRWARPLTGVLPFHCRRAPVARGLARTASRQSAACVCAERSGQYRQEPGWRSYRQDADFLRSARGNIIGTCGRARPPS